MVRFEGRLASRLYFAHVVEKDLIGIHMRFEYWDGTTG